MIRIPFLSPARASQFLGADSGLECAALWHDGATLWLIVGGQTGGWSQRERIWVHDRLPGGPHAEKAYSGYWGRGSLPRVALVKNLRYQNMTLESTPEGFPLAHVPAGANHGAWDNYDGFGPFSGLVNVRAQLFDAQTGASIADGINNSPGATIAPLANGQSAILRARAEGVAPLYAWPPPNYRAISGESSDTPSQFAWTHPTRGTLYFDPRFSVGARPYERAEPAQAKLLDAEGAALASGTTRKVPEWVTFLIEFNEDGSAVTENGEWSMLRLVGGNGAWIGDANVHPGATIPALWRATLDPATMRLTAPLAPWVIDPCLRMVGALEVGSDGQLIVGGALAGRSGPLPVVLEIQTPDIAGDGATTDATLSVFSCECCEPLGKGLRGLAQTLSGLRAVSPCDSFRRTPAAPLFRRLIPSHPGGRNAIVVRIGSREFYVFSTEGGDFATSRVHQSAHGYLVIEDGRGQKRTGAPLAKQLDSCLATLGARLLGIEEWSKSGQMPYDQTLANRLQSYQALGASSDGAQWERLVSWQVLDFDAGPVARCGNLQDGAMLFALGTTGEGDAMKGRALRLAGGVAEQNLGCDYFVQRVSTFAHAGEEWMVGIGLKHDPGGFTSGFGREQFVLLSKGEPATVILTWTGDGFCTPIDAFEQWGIDVSGLPTVLVWTGFCWMTSETIPTDGSPYLTLDIGADTLCYNLVCPSGGVDCLPYDPEDFPSIVYTEGVDCWPPLGPTNADEAIDLMPPGTKVSLSVLSDYEDSIGADGAILQGSVSAVEFFPALHHATIPAWRYEALYPFSLWIRVDAAVPLQLEDGEQLTPTIRAQLAGFNQKAHVELKKIVAVAATKRVEASLLLAPGWSVSSQDLKVRG